MADADGGLGEDQVVARAGVRRPELGLAGNGRGGGVEPVEGRRRERRPLARGQPPPDLGVPVHAVRPRLLDQQLTAHPLLDDLAPREGAVDRPAHVEGVGEVRLGQHGVADAGDRGAGRFGDLVGFGRARGQDESEEEGGAGHRAGRSRSSR